MFQEDQPFHPDGLARGLNERVDQQTNIHLLNLRDVEILANIWNKNGARIIEISRFRTLQKQIANFLKHWTIHHVLNNSLRYFLSLEHFCKLLDQIRKMVFLVNKNLNQFKRKQNVLVANNLILNTMVEWSIQPNDILIERLIISILVKII